MLKIGCTSKYVPVEIFFAFEAKPYYVWEHMLKEDAEKTLGEALRFMNPYHRAILGESSHKNTELYIVAHTDCHASRMGEMLEARGMEVFSVGISPLYESDEAVDYYVKEINCVKRYLEMKTGKKFNPQKLSETLKDFENVQKSLSEIDHIRKEYPMLLSGSQFIAIQFKIYAICEKSREQAMQYLNRTKKELSKKTNCIQNNQNPIVPRIMIISRVLIREDIELLQMIENCGCRILYELVDENMYDDYMETGEGDDMIKVLAESRIHTQYPPNFFQGSWRKRYEFMKKKMQEHQIDGVIWHQLSFDEIYDLEYMMWSKWAAKDGIDILRMESSYEETSEDRENMITRVESFIKVLEWKKDGEQDL